MGTNHVGSGPCMSACQSTTKLVANLHAFVRLNIVGRHHNAAALQALAGPSGAKTWRGVGVYEPPHMSPPPLPRPLLHPRVASRISHGAGTPCSHHACRTELALQWAWLCVRGLTATLLVPVAAWCRSNRCRRSGARCVNPRELACHGSRLISGLMETQLLNMRHPALSLRAEDRGRRGSLQGRQRQHQAERCGSAAGPGPCMHACTRAHTAAWICASAARRRSPCSPLR